MAEWEREFAVDPEAVWRAAGSPGAWRLLGAGWDCDAWLADERIVWRVPRRAAGLAALRREARIMPALAPWLPAPAPVTTLVEVEGLPALGWHPVIRGRELADLVDPPATDPRLGRALGTFLRSLHAPARADDLGGRLPVDPMGRADPERRLPIAHGRLDQVANQVAAGPLHAIVDAAAGAALPAEVVCHGDLHIRHVLVDTAGELAGVIDWGDACRGARAMDLAVVTALPAPEQAAFHDTYGPVDPREWRHARMLGVMFGASLLAAERAGARGQAARRWLERLAAMPEGPAELMS